jgi:hypothetical protein
MTPYLNTPATEKMKQAIEKLKASVKKHSTIVEKAKKFH